MTAAIVVYLAIGLLVARVGARRRARYFGTTVKYQVRQYFGWWTLVALAWPMVADLAVKYAGRQK